MIFIIVWGLNHFPGLTGVAIGSGVALVAALVAALCIRNRDHVRAGGAA